MMYLLVLLCMALLIVVGNQGIAAYSRSIRRAQRQRKELEVLQWKYSALHDVMVRVAKDDVGNPQLEAQLLLESIDPPSIHY